MPHPLSKIVQILFFCNRCNSILSFGGPQLYNLEALSFTYDQYVLIELADKLYNSVTVCFCVSPWIFIQINNFSKLPAAGIEPLTLGLQSQRSTSTQWGTHRSDTYETPCNSTSWIAISLEQSSLPIVYMGTSINDVTIFFWFLLNPLHATNFVILWVIKFSSIFDPFPITSFMDGPYIDFPFSFIFANVDVVESSFLLLRCCPFKPKLLEITRFITMQS